MEAAQAFLVLVCLPGSLIAGPVKYSWPDASINDIYPGSSQCASTCTENDNFGYENGKTYRYAYEVTGVSSIPGASDQSARIFASAHAHIHIISKCEMALTLSDVAFKTSDPDSSTLNDVGDYQYISLLEESPLYFSFQDGRVEELCFTSSSEDNTDALNFKRGILSAFQNSMGQHHMDQSLRELDVSGKCPTEYVVTQKGWKSTEISKSKDLLGCKDHQHFKTSLQSTPFHLPDAMQSLPILKGELKCSHTITKDKILSKVSCIESLVFRPFSKKESGAKTETTQKLEFIDTSASPSLMRGALSQRTSLLFEHVHKGDDDGEEIWAVRDKLEELCKFSNDGIKKQVPGLFAEMVYLMKELHYDALNDLLNGVNNGLISSDNKEKAKDFIMDALPMIGTKGSVKMMVDLLLSGDVTGLQSTLWVKSFTFLHHPSEDMIKDSLERLLLSEKLRTESLLPVTSAIHNYCLDKVDCQSQNGVVNVVNILHDILGRDCRASDENLILMTLRAAGNLGFSDSLVPTLENCIEMSGNSMNVRVTAVQAFRGVTCNAKRNSLMDTFRNVGEDSELRINAYLGVMMCPNQMVLEKVKTMLESEEINQVGSFVWTHLTNLAETSSPHKQELKEILQDEKLQKEFDMDKRKYSRNYEISYFLDRFGIGSQAESNLIWSSSSFLPRSVMLNLTVDVLGHSVNLFEVGGRVQGLQQLLHDYIGSKLKNDDKSKGPSGCANKRKMDDMKEKHKVNEEDLTASMYLRMFGNELDFKHFSKKDIMDLNNKMSVKSIVASLANGKDISFTHSAMFLDSTIIVPTIAGMSLQLSVNGTASVQLKASGKMDLRRLTLKRMEINFDLRPSGAVQIGGEMTLNAGVMKSGLKMTTALHSSTAFTGSMDLTNGQVLTVTADTPRDKMELLDVQSEFFIVHTNAVRKQKMLEDKAAIQQRGCSDKSWLTGMGYELCGHVSYINATMIEDAPYFPLTGPLSGNIVLHKRDAPQGFKLLAEDIVNSNTRLGRVCIDTPGSNVDRDLSLSYFVDTGAQSVEMEVTSPWTKVLVKGLYNTRKASGTIMIDGKTYELTLNLKKDEQSKKIIWTPELQMLRPKDSKLLSKVPESLKMSGSVTIAKKLDEIVADIDIVTDIMPNPIKVQANYIDKKAQKTVSASVILNKKDGYSATFQVLQTFFGKNTYPSKIKPTILISGPKGRPFLLSGNIDYKKDKLVKSNIQVMMDRTLKSPIVLTFKVIESKSRFKGNGKVSSQFGTVKTKGYVDIPGDTKGKRKSPLLSSKIVTSYNLPVIKDKRLRKNLVIFSSKFHDRSSKALTKYDADVIFESRNYQQASFVASADLTHKSTYSKSIITYKSGPKSKNFRDKSKQLKIEAFLHHKLAKKDVHIKYDVQILYPIKEIEWQLNGKHEHHLKQKISIETYNSFIFAKGKNSELRFKIDSAGKKFWDYTGLLEFNYPPFKLGDKAVDGRSYRLVSTMKQPGKKEFVHSVQMNVNKDLVHTMVTRVDYVKSTNYKLNSHIVIDGEERTKITLKQSSVNKERDISVKFEKNSKIYQVDGSLTLDGNHCTNTWDVILPTRRVQGSLEAGQKKNGGYMMKLSALPDADKDATKKIETNFVLDSQQDSSMTKFDLDMSVETPFEGYQVFVFKRFLELNPKENKDEFKVVWGQKEKELSYKSWLLRPISLKRFQMDFEVVTPLENLRIYRTEIRHRFDGSNYLATSMKSKYNERDVSIDVLMSNRRTQLHNNVDSKLNINLWGAKRDTLSFKIGNFPTDLSFTPLSSGWPKQLKLEVSHNGDGMVYDSKVLYMQDDVESKVDLHMTHTRAGKMINVKSHMNILLGALTPNPIHLELTHANTLTNLNTTISSRWGIAQRANLDVGASFLKHDQTLFVHYSGTTKDIQDIIYKHHHNTLNGWSGSNFFQINKDLRTQSSSKYKITKTDLSFESSAPTSRMTVKAEYEHYPYTVFLKGSYRNGTKWDDVVFDGSVIRNGQSDWTSDMRLVTPSSNFAINGNLKDNGQNEWMLVGDISLDVRKEIKLKFVVDAEKWSKFEADLESPWKDVSFNIDHKKQRKSFKTNVGLTYDKVKRFSAQFNGRSKFPEKTTFSVDLSTPYDILQNANLKGSLNKVDEKWVGSMNLKTSNEKLKFFNLYFQHALSIEKEFFEHGIDITSSAFDRVATGIQLNWSDKDKFANLTLVAPDIGRTVLGFKLEAESWLDFHERLFGEINGYDLDMDIGLKHTELSTRTWFTFSYPGADKSYIKTSMYRIGNSAMDFDVGGDLQIGRNKRPYKTSVQFSFVDDKTAIGATFDNPMLKNDFSFLLKNERKHDISRSTIVYFKYGDEYMLDIKDEHFITETSFKGSHHTSYMFDGKGHMTDQKYDIVFSKKNEASFEVTSKFDDKEITVEGELTGMFMPPIRKATSDIFVTTPFDNFRNLEFHTSFEKESENKFNGKWLLEYMDGKEADLTFDLKINKRKVVVNGVLLLPVKGYEKTSVNIVSIEKKNVLTVKGKAISGQEVLLEATLEFDENREFIFNVIGPIKEFKTLKIAGKFNKKEKSMNGDIQIQLSLHPKPITVEYGFENKPRGTKWTYKLRSPYENFKRADLTINFSHHRKNDLSCIAILTSEKLGKITLDTKWLYQSPVSNEVKIALTSSIENMENLRLTLNTHSIKKGSVDSQIEVGWDINKEITLHTTWNEEESKPYKMATTFDLTTPFEEIKVLNLKLTEFKGRETASMSIFVRQNERTYLDSDFSLKIVDDTIEKGSIDMRNPRPMSASVEGKIEDRVVDGKMILNWDKRSPESKFVFTLHMSDKSDKSNIDTEFAFKVVHPVRIMAVKYLLRKAQNEMQTIGLITWDESNGNTFSYDLGYTDRSSMYSKMYDAQIKVGVPQRSVKLLGSYGDTGSSRTMTGTALWDADRDDTKKVTLSTSHEYSQRMERLNMNLNLPSINKQLNVGVSLKKGYGSSILDSKAEISYSSDPLKTIIITNKVDNTVLDTADQDNFNYTMETRFKHAVTDIDLQWLSHISRVDKIVSVGNMFTYLTLNKDQKTFAWRIETDNDKHGELMITTPLKSVRIVGKRLTVNGFPSSSVELWEDGKRTMALSGILRPRNKNFDISFKYDRDDPRKTLFVNGAYISDHAAELSVFDNVGVYAKVNVKMNSSHIIHHRIIWKPSLPVEVKTFMSTKVTEFSYAVKEVWDDVVKNVGVEVKAKYLRVSQELRDEMGQLFSLIMKEMEDFSVQLETLRTQIRRIYNRNDLNIRDMGQQMEEALRELLGLIQTVVKNYRSYYNTISQGINDWINNLKNYPISLMYGKTINEIIETMKEVRMALEQTLQDVVIELEKLSSYSYKKYLKISREMDHKLNSYLHSKRQLAVFRKMREEREKLLRMGADYKSEDLKAMDKLYLQTQQTLEDQFHDLMTREEFQQMHAMGTEIYQQLKYWNAERGVGTALSRLLDLSKTLILMELTKAKNVLMDFKKSRMTYYNPQQGEMQFEVYVPFEMKSFSQLPEFKIGRYAKDAYKWLENRMPNFDSSMSDMYYGYVPSLKPSDWLPPFDATGYVIGSQHILTFDNAHMDFLSSCSHVLVRDMLNDSFSVILNYDKNPRRHGIKSLCFNIGNSLSLEITKDYQLTVNNQETEMPFVNDLVRVVRDGDTIRLQYINGIEVVSNPSLDLYKVVLSGWFHGRTAGLLGMYDNEKKNDETMLDQSHEMEVNRKYCNRKNLVQTPDPGQDIDGVCASLFQDTASKFRPCFKQVDPSAFLQLCQRYMSSMSDSAAIHMATEQYRTVCRDVGVFMGPLEEYIPCNKEDTFFVEGTDPLYQSADVVFVVEDIKCNNWASSHLTTMVTEMNKALSQSGMKGNRFGMTGYKGVDATVRTIHGNHFGKANMFLKAVETLKLGELDESGDLMTAVRTAMKYPFRPGVAKVMVIAPCTSCQVGLLERNLDSALRLAGFKVHILQEQGFTVQGNDYDKLPSYRVYGMDNSNTITNRISNEIEPSSVFMSSNDYCNTIASTTNGSIFDTSHLTNSKGRVKREFIKSFANKVGWTKLPYCQMCQCNSESQKLECQLCEKRSYLSYLPMTPVALDVIVGDLHDLHYEIKNSFDDIKV